MTTNIARASANFMYSAPTRDPPTRVMTRMAHNKAMATAPVIITVLIISAPKYSKCSGVWHQPCLSDRRAPRKGFGGSWVRVARG